MKVSLSTRPPSRQVLVGKSQSTTPSRQTTCCRTTDAPPPHPYPVQSTKCVVQSFLVDRGRACHSSCRQADFPDNEQSRLGSSRRLGIHLAPIFPGTFASGCLSLPLSIFLFHCLHFLSQFPVGSLLFSLFFSRLFLASRVIFFAIPISTSLFAPSSLVPLLPHLLSSLSYRFSVIHSIISLISHFSRCAEREAARQNRD